jgi:hypothetical protein
LIGLATPYQTNNYGTKLQALALQKTVTDLGYENEIIRYGFGDKGIILKKLLLNERGKRRKKEQARREALSRDPETKWLLGQREQAFQVFTNRCYTLSAPCRHLSDVRTQCAKYEAVICGSDQIWLPSHVLLDYYTLNFVPRGVKRIAYAPSFGVGRLPRWMLGDYRAFLRRMDTLTVREDRGAELVKQLTGRPCPVVADPTLLLTPAQWEAMLEPLVPPIGQPYVFTYFLGNQEEYRKMAMAYASAHGCCLVTLPHVSTMNRCDLVYADKPLYDISPFQFLQLIHDAECVFTDSFHASVFSILFHRPFFVLERFSRTDAASTNDRLYSLLRAAGLEKQMLCECDAESTRAATIPYAEVGQKMEIIRDRSLKILADALEANT